MTNTAFFTLKANEMHPLASTAIALAKEICDNKERFPKFSRLQGEFLNAFKRIKDRIFASADKDQNFIPTEIPMDVYESFALMHSLSTSLYSLKGHMNSRGKGEKPISIENEEQIDAFYDMMPEKSPDLIIRLTEAWNYFDYGLQTLEEIFDIKIAVRPIKTDDREEISTIGINEANSNLFSFMFGWLDSLKLIVNEYEFAGKFYRCQFMHISDYDNLRKKLIERGRKKKIPMTLRDNIALYYAFSLLGRFFLSDSVKFFEEISAEADAMHPERTITALEVRNHFLKFSDDYMGLMRKLLGKNKIFNEYIAKINQWEIA